MPKSSKPQNTKDKLTKRRVEPLTGKPSTAGDAISNTTYQSRKRVDPLSGKPSRAEDAISYAAYLRKKKVDPLTGKPSTLKDAISYTAYIARKKVDPLTGEPSTAEDAISYNTYQSRKKVDPLTGEPSTADNAISASAYKNRKKVDPLTGKVSTADNAISAATYRGRKKVDPLTGEPSTADNAISYNTYFSRKKVDPLTGEPSIADNAISYTAYKKRNIREVSTATINQPSMPNGETETTENNTTISIIPLKKTQSNRAEATIKRKASLSVTLPSSKKRKGQSGAVDNVSLMPGSTAESRDHEVLEDLLDPENKSQDIGIRTNHPLRFFQERSPEEPFNREEVMAVVKILRGNNNKGDNF